MTRRDWLTVAQGLLIGLQGVNATLAQSHGNLYITVAALALLSAGQYIVHNMGLDTPTMAEEKKAK
jgi:hypothetical protein